MLRQTYLELVLNEFYACYGIQIERGELFLASLEHPYLLIEREIYLVLQTGVVKLPLTENIYKVQAQYGRVEAIAPVPLYSLAQSPKLKAICPKASSQLVQFASRIEQRLTQTTLEGLMLLSQRLEGVGEGVENLDEIEAYTAYFWHGVFASEQTTLIGTERELAG